MIFKRKWLVVLLLAVAFAVRADLQLSGVIFSQGNPSVVVNGKMYRIGAEVDGFTVVAIEKQSATFRNVSTGKEIVLPFGGSVELSPAAKSDSKSQQAAQYVSTVMGDIEAGEISLPPASAGAQKAGMILMIALNLLMIVAWWRVCSKAGQPGWSIFIPIYNLYVMLKIADKPWWWLLLMLVPGVNLIVSILVSVGIAREFGKGAGFALGLIFLPMIFYPVLAFSSAEYMAVPSSSE